jgi:hypothetical protein
VYRAYGKAGVRVDLVAEAVGLHLQRDREDPDLAGPEPTAALSASGGDIFYGSAGLRAYLGRVALGLGIKRALLKSLNEGAEQQGSEALEDFRLAFAISATAPF